MGRCWGALEISDWLSGLSVSVRMCRDFVRSLSITPPTVWQPHCNVCVWCDLIIVNCLIVSEKKEERCFSVCDEYGRRPQRMLPRALLHQSQSGVTLLQCRHHQCFYFFTILFSYCSTSLSYSGFTLTILHRLNSIPRSFSSETDQLHRRKCINYSLGDCSRN